MKPKDICTFCLYFFFICSSVAQYRGSFPHDAYILGDAVRVREEPNSNAKKVCELNFGTHVMVMKESENSDKFGGPNAYFWVEIKTDDGKRGWTYGKYVQPVKKEIEKLTKEKFSFNDKSFDLCFVEVLHGRYMDSKNSEGIGAMQGTFLICLLENDNLSKVSFIRNQEKHSSSKRIGNYWTMLMPCCGGNNYFENLHVGGDNIFIGWWDGGFSENESWNQSSYKLKFTEGKGFRLAEVKQMIFYNNKD